MSGVRQHSVARLSETEALALAKVADLATEQGALCRSFKPVHQELSAKRCRPSPILTESCMPW